jgi:hypothetical protein
MHLASQAAKNGKMADRYDSLAQQAEAGGV